MSRIEWYASLYLDKGRICIPALVIEASMVNGAKKLKLGQQAQSGMFVDGNMILDFDGADLTPDQLWERDQNRLSVPVKIQKNKVIRTRFIADHWSGFFEVNYDDGVLNKSSVVDIINSAGNQVGFGTWRPRFGRFSAELV